jgi:Predicted acetamidase/formamidase
MQVIPKSKFTYLYDGKAVPAATVKPGEVFQVETEDAFNGLIKKESDCTPENIEKIVHRSNPLTGPVKIEGAEPGDTVSIHILSIECLEYGVSILGDHFGPVSHLFPKHVAKIVPISGGAAHFNEKIKIPLEPMIGSIGVASDEETIFSWKQGHYGGNMDCKEVKAGSILQLPVSVPGAMLVMGDVHGIQGDGEMCNPFEVPAKITLKVELIKNKKISNPRVLTPDKIMTIASGRTFEACSNEAFIALANWLAEDYGFTFNDACFLLGQVADVRACQIANTMHTVRCEMPARYVSN